MINIRFKCSIWWFYSYIHRLHPKALEIFKHDKEVFNETELYIDAGDWFVNQLIHNDTILIIIT